jgi:recombination protein RecR
MAFHMLDRDREGAQQLARHGPARSRASATASAAACSPRSVCADLCFTQRDSEPALRRRDAPRTSSRSRLSGGFSGLYFVLMGHLSPLDGIGPKQLRARRASSGVSTKGR